MDAVVAGLIGGAAALLVLLICAVRVTAAQTIAALAFGAGKKAGDDADEEEVALWLRTRHSRLPALHICRGHPLTLLVSHSNYESLADVRGAPS